MNFEFSRIFKTNLTSVKYLKRHFLNHPACFFLEQTTDRKIELLISVLRLPPQCTALQLLAEPLQNKICHTLHAKFMPFSCFPIICLPAIWKSFFYEIGVTYAIIDWMLFQPSANNFCYVPTIPLYISWKYKYWCNQNGLCDVVQPLDM